MNPQAGPTLLGGAVLILCLSGCASFSKGVTSALMERQAAAEPVPKMCQIDGPEFAGLMGRHSDPGPASNKETEPAKLKVMIVHGVGDTAPGYANRLISNLNQQLGVTTQIGHAASLALATTVDNHGSPGELQVRKFLTEDNTEVMYFEVLWSPITRPLKKRLEYDLGDAFGKLRTPTNHQIKAYMTRHMMDPMIYFGPKQPEILETVSQASCWMFAIDDTTEINEISDAFCDLTDPDANLASLHRDRVAFVTYSMGSRIVVDMLQHTAIQAASDSYGGDPARQARADEILKVLQAKSYPVFMLANQISLMQLADSTPAIVGQQAEFCSADSKLADKRLVGGISLIAFNDPNDLLTYPVPERFAEQHLDSRLCAQVANININVAAINKIPVLGQFANPAEAHSGYDNNADIMQLIAHGTDKVPNDCHWTRHIQPTKESRLVQSLLH